jgi:hypothetical protein
VRGIRDEAPVRRIRGASNITELFDLGGRFDRNEITKSEIDRLRNMIDEKGACPVAAELGISPVTLLLVTSGFGHRLAVKTAARIKEFLR